MMKSFLLNLNINISEVESIISITLSILTAFIALYNILKKRIEKYRVINKLKKTLEKKELKILKEAVDQLNLEDIKQIKNYQQFTLFSQPPKDDLSPEILDVLKVIDSMKTNKFIDNIIYFIFELEYYFLVRMKKTGDSLKDSGNVFKETFGDIVEYFTYILNIVIKIIHIIAKLIFILFIIIIYIGTFVAGVMVVYMIFKGIITPVIIKFYLSKLPVFFKIISTMLIVIGLVVLESKEKRKTND